MTVSETNLSERRRRIRRLALQMLYQIDAQDGENLDAVPESLHHAADDPNEHFDGLWKVVAPPDPAEHRAGFERAQGAWTLRLEADCLATELSPLWPTHRQPVLDRNIIRLCWFEMTRGGVPPKVAVNEAVELGKTFSTERSAQFLNGILDKLLKKVLHGNAVEISAKTGCPTPEAGTD